MNSAEPLLDLATLDQLRSLPSDDPRGMLGRVVALFLCDAPILFDDTRMDIAEQRLERARDHVHSLRSYAGTVGAVQLQSALERVERSVRMGDLDNATVHLAVATEALDRTIAALGVEVSR